ncbi:MAG TPA: AarF/ABC1/UbiB kinase family protein [Bacteroidetes bacterium]|nr:AarF/ABC1/UbiB kinase family protein [Bacteroidota bacterium]HIL58977.1 AarF/ABC1/UbiB kinase family protein [Rhodothermales bacterium]
MPTLRALSRVARAMPTPTPESPPILAASGDGLASAPPPLPGEVPPEQAPAIREAIEIARPPSQRFRVLRAYAAALRIAASYLAFRLVAKVRGPRWAARNRTALHARNGRRAHDAILRLRGLFIKAGQLASALTNFLPEPFRDELEGLQDRVPANAFALVRERLADELGATPEALFESVTEAPVASASLAQVHRARLGGRDVALKVQHADIEAIAELDLRAIRTILRAAGRYFGIRGLNAQMDEIEAVIRAELDFRQEAANVEAVGAAIRDLPGVEVPTIVPGRSAQRVLTTEWVDAIRAGDLAALDAAGIDREALARRLLDTYGRMVFAEGAYHADPHPGNLLVRPDPEAPDGFALVFLDFGAVARLTPDMRRGLAEMVAGTLARDAGRVTAALGLMGFVATDASGVDQAVIQLVENINREVLQGIDPSEFTLGDIGMAQSLEQQRIAFDQMDQLNVSIRDLAGAFRVPRDWILLERTALLLVGLCTSLAPGLNPFTVVWPYVEPLAGEAAPGVRRAIRDRALDELRLVAGLPRRIDRVLREAEAGALSVRSPDVLAVGDRVAASVDRLTLTVAAVGLGALATTASGAWVWVAGIGAGVAGVSALLRR